MCGIAGSLDLARSEPPDLNTLRRMLGLIRHRGPDAFGVYLDDRVGLGSARLSIIDLAGGTQPIHNEDETVWIVFNGEIFNYVELRKGLIARGHRFHTRSDTEVIVHLYEERGERCVEALNGQFAFALWDSRSGQLLLGRDRLGVRPLFYAVTHGTLLFASEIKAIFADDRVSRELDPCALEELFTFWAPLPGRTAFRGIHEVPPGHTLSVRWDSPRLRRYWALSFPPGHAADGRAGSDYVGSFRELLIDATMLRLRADVPVGAYLSGGLDSSTIAAIIRRFNPNRLHTFSITFEDSEFDEGVYQQQMAMHLGVEHHTIVCTDADIGRAFPEVVWHSEVPILRTAPVPLYLLSKLVRDNGFKVVLTGEGADEFLGGYNIFKEDRIRRFWARDPASRLRPLLLRRLYPYIRELQREEQAYLEAFFRNGLTETGRKGYSHLVRWRNTSRLKRFFSQELQQSLVGFDLEVELERALDGLSLSWDPLSQAQYVEVTTFLSQYLLSSQGDRMAMAHSVEGRFPFLDHRVVEFCSRVPASLKLHGLTEKYLLKSAVEDLVPEEIRWRPKQPYRAPVARTFFGPHRPEYVADLLSPPAVERAGYFNPLSVQRLVEKARRVPDLSEMDSMAVAGILSVQLLHHLFVEGFPARSRAPLPDLAIVIDRSLCRL